MTIGAQVKHVTPKQIRQTLTDLFLYSESRGKEAAGAAFSGGTQIDVLKSATSASKMIRSTEYGALVSAFLDAHCTPENNGLNHPMSIIGHSRLVTTGSQYAAHNNQPVLAGKMVGVHNGIIVNHEALWHQFPALQRRYQVDTEILFSLLRMRYTESGSIISAVRQTFGAIEGTASIAAMFEDLDLLVLATNNGSLYRCVNADRSAVLFASERYILQRLLQRAHTSAWFGAPTEIRQILPGSGCIVHTTPFVVEEFGFDVSPARAESFAALSNPRRIIEHECAAPQRRTPSNIAHERVGISELLDERSAKELERLKQRFPYDTSWQDSLRRCAKCILPETMPFIEFDADGVCNYCRNYKKIECFGEDALQEIARPYRRGSGVPDCVVGLSGGRDSLYSLHYVKTVLKMSPVAYTYDWGMVTDLARRNISRICAKLGVEHILVSANISHKRRFIKQNVSAWLKRPELGMIPLFMAGDKQYFYYLQQVKKQLGVHLAILGENMLERTDFKTGFAGVRPYNADPHHVYTLSGMNKWQLLWYYGQQYLSNPAYINISVADTLFAAVCYYVIGRNFSNLYNYVPWQEEVIIPTLREEYHFELAPDSVTTWRIGDGTAAFYNYIYHTVAGFTENETFRSNQIREGMLNRDDALKLVQEENRPRYETIFWYLNIIELGIPIEQVFERIQAIPKRRVLGGMS